MGLPSLLEDIEKIAEGASATPTPLTTVNGVTYQSEEARLERNRKQTKNKSAQANRGKRRKIVPRPSQKSLQGKEEIIRYIVYLEKALNEYGFETQKLDIGQKTRKNQKNSSIDNYKLIEDKKSGSGSKEVLQKRINALLLQTEKYQNDLVSAKTRIKTLEYEIRELVNANNRGRNRAKKTK